MSFFLHSLCVFFFYSSNSREQFDGTEEKKKASILLLVVVTFSSSYLLSDVVRIGKEEGDSQVNEGLRACKSLERK